MNTLSKIQDLDVKGKTVILRVDFNVPITHGKIDDDTRIVRVLPTINYLVDNGCKVVIISHFGRPKGKFVRECSLAFLVDELNKYLNHKEIKFAVDCIGEESKLAVGQLLPGQIILMENLRFHAEEETNDHEFSKALSQLGDIYINDAFSCSHRSHASIVGITEHIPSGAGFLLQEEIEHLEKIFNNPVRPLAAIIGGSKVSTKLNLLHSLMSRADMLVIGGAMANTFLKARGVKIGNSIYEESLLNEAIEILNKAEENRCEIILPVDIVSNKEFGGNKNCRVTPIEMIGDEDIILDIGPKTVNLIENKLANVKTLIWNGPLGAFEYRPYDIGTTSLARDVAELTNSGKLISIAGGGDIVAALTNAGLVDNFTYISTGGGAFLEWLEGKDLPGISALKRSDKVPFEGYLMV